MTTWLDIDGAAGEGGGQILRSSLTLSLVTGRPFRMERIRAQRRKPGLLRQHLTAVLAAADIGGARVTGATVGSGAVTFEPGPVRGGDYHLAVGTAGSATLVLQTVLPALLLARGPSRLTLEGGTHNPAAPPYDFLTTAFLPLLRRMGANVATTLDAYGFYPAGGGRFTVTIEPTARLQPLSLTERGEARVRARAVVASLPENIARRELGIVRERFGLDRTACVVQSIDASIGPGNVVSILLESDQVTEVVSGFGARGVTAEKVASDACDEAEAYLNAGVPVGVHLADQLLVPLALAGSGAFRTLRPSAHTETNAAVIRQFMDVGISFDAEPGGTCRITVARNTESKERES